MKKITYYISIALFLSIFVFQGYAQNLISNGDFEAGNTGFTSLYQYVVPVGDNPLWNPGLYTIDSVPSNVHGGWPSIGDHTSGSGDMLIVNGADPNSGQNYTTFWSESIDVLPNTLYTFTYWVASCADENYALIQASINDVALGNVKVAPSVGSGWVEVSCPWDSGLNTSVTIKLDDLKKKYSGDDFVIDDISLVPQGGTNKDLCAGQYEHVGSVYANNDCDNVYVLIFINKDWNVVNTEIHVDVATTPAGLKKNKKHNPVVGQFDSKNYEPVIINSIDKTIVMYVLPREAVVTDANTENDPNLYIAAHVALTGPEGQSESAWVCDGSLFREIEVSESDLEITGVGSWATYFSIQDKCP